MEILPQYLNLNAADCFSQPLCLPPDGSHIILSLAVTASTLVLVVSLLTLLKWCQGLYVASGQQKHCPLQSQSSVTGWEPWVPSAQVVWYLKEEASNTI